MAEIPRYQLVRGGGFPKGYTRIYDVLLERYASKVIPSAEANTRANRMNARAKPVWSEPHSGKVVRMNPAGQRVFFISRMTSPKGWFVYDDRGRTVEFQVGGRIVWYFKSERAVKKMILRAFPGSLVKLT